MATKTFRKGSKAALESIGGSGIFLSVKADSAVTFAPLTGLDEVISADMHQFWEINPALIFPCIGEGCPGCEAGNEPGFKAYMPVVTKEGDVKIFPMGISILRQLDEYEAEVESIRGYVIKIKRTGAGLSTRYSTVPLGKTIDIDEYEAPNIVEALGTTDRDEILEKMRERGLASGSSASSGDEEEDEGVF